MASYRVTVGKWCGSFLSESVAKWLCHTLGRYWSKGDLTGVYFWETDRLSPPLLVEVILSEMQTGSEREDGGHLLVALLGLATP